MFSSYHIPLPSALSTTNPHFSDLLSSDTLEIIAESGKKRFTVHSGIFATQSETASRKVDLSAWDGETVGRFFQFLYIGNYEYPGIPSEDAMTEDETGDDDDEGERRGGVNTPDTVQSVAAREEWGFGNEGVNLLLVHAKVYTLAQHRGIEALRVMALERLAATLGGVGGRMSKGFRNAANVLELLGYVYSYTEYRREEPIRELVSKFAAGNIETLVGREEMSVLLRKEGSLAVELMERVAGRLGEVRVSYEMEGELQDWKNRAIASDEKIRVLEATSKEEMQQLVAENEEKVKELESINAEKVQVLEADVLKWRAIYDQAKRSYPYIELGTWEGLILSRYGVYFFLVCMSIWIMPGITVSVLFLTVVTYLLFCCL